MTDGTEGKNFSRPQSKFEWRPDDITILNEEESTAAEVEYQEQLAEMEAEEGSRNSDASPDIAYSQGRSKKLGPPDFKTE